MCGIAGYFGKKNLIKDKLHTNKLIHIMRSRGPDGKGVFESRIKIIYF